MADNHGNQNQGGTNKAVAVNTEKQSGEFTIEFGDNHGRQISVHTLRKHYRGFFSLTNLHRRVDSDGKLIGGRPVGDAMSQIPDSPGIRMTVNMDNGQVKEHDPLADDPELLTRICRILSRAHGGAGIEKKAHPGKEYSLDESTLKTLVRECSRLVLGKKAVLVSGRIPNEAAIKAMPGRFLFDPWNSDPGKFRYEDEYETWLAKRQTAGAM